MSASVDRTSLVNNQGQDSLPSYDHESIPCDYGAQLQSGHPASGDEGILFVDGLEELLSSAA
jgi:hypothetical protein